VPRYALAYDGPTRAAFVAHSGNRKLGDLPVTMTTGDTCPRACPWFGCGCYAECTYVALHWGRLQKGLRGLRWKAFCQEVANLPAGTAWRHNDAGDLPGKGERLNVGKLYRLIESNRGRRGFSYTHKQLLRRKERDAVRFANENGFTINLSADSPDEADALLSLGIAPVVLTWPVLLPRTPNGAAVRLCRHQESGVTCDKCLSCIHAERTHVIQILPHSLRGRQVAQLSKRTGIELRYAPNGDGRLSRWEAGAP